MRGPRILLEILAISVALTGCGKPKPASLTIQNTVEMGVVQPSTDYHENVTILNETGRVVQILKVTPSCSCTKVDYPRNPIQPGASAGLKVQIRTPERPGTGAASVMIETEGSSKLLQTQINFWVKPETGLVVFPEVLRFNFHQGSSQTMIGDLIVEGPTPIVESLSLDSPSASLGIKSREPETGSRNITRRKFIVTAEQGANLSAPIYGDLTAKAPNFEQKIPFVIEPYIKRSGFPSSVFFGRLNPGQEVTKEVRVYSSTQPIIEVTMIEGSPMPKIALQKADEQMYLVFITLRVPDTAAGVIRGKLHFNPKKADSGEAELLAFAGGKPVSR